MNIKRIYTLLAASLLLLILAGCGSNSEAGNTNAVNMEPDTFSKQDMAIYKIDNSKERVSYGMSRKAAEKVLGTGVEGITNSYTYESGVNVLYREDKAVAIRLQGGTQGEFRTARGAEAGMTKAEIKQLYGEKYALESSGRTMETMEYYYNAETGQQLDEEAAKEAYSLSREELIATHLISTAYDAEGRATLIMLMDGLAANTMQ